MSQIKYHAIDHHSVVVKDLTLSKAFYIDVLGMVDDDAVRPSIISFPGSFVRAGRSQIHIMEVNNVDPTTSRPKMWFDRHVAVSVDSLQPLVDRMKAKKWPFEKNPFNDHALFVRDPDGNGIEVIEMNGS